MRGLLMKELSISEIQRQDYVDGKIHELINSLNPSLKQIDWNIEMIADIREKIRYWIVESYQVSNEQTFYPYIPE